METYQAEPPFKASLKHRARTRCHYFSGSCASPEFPAYDGGQRMSWKDQQGTARLSWTPAPYSSPNCESPFLENIALLNLASFFTFTREEKRSPDQPFQALLSECNRELAALLREVNALPNVAPESAHLVDPNHQLMMRAVQCAVKQHRLQTELSNLALTDELTGLYNRRGFMCLTEWQLKLANRTGNEMLLFFIDVDGLKRINDSFGHSEGDFALIRAAKALAKTFRGSDVLARLDGDEFAALAIDASAETEGAILTRLNEHLESVKAQELRYPLSLSVGAVRFSSATACTIAEMMIHADRAMYNAKRNRRMSAGQSEAMDSSKGVSESPLPFCLNKQPRDARSRSQGSSHAYETEAIPSHSQLRGT